jgi:hypothetical protein
MSVVQRENAGVFIKATDELMRGHNGFQFELDKVYTHPDMVHVCHLGFHCCPELDHIDLVSPYPKNGHTRYFVVRAWGTQDSMETRFRGEDLIKHAFSCMEFVKELKYKTLGDVQQAVADIKEMFHDEPVLRDANLRQFLKLQLKFPSILKKRVKKLRGRSIVLEDINGVSLAPTCFQTCYLPGSPFLEQPWTWVSDPWITKMEAGWDIYHADHEPRLGLNTEDAKEYINQLTSRGK